jgi:hypothetical protein
MIDAISSSVLPASRLGRRPATTKMEATVAAPAAQLLTGKSRFFDQNYLS